MMRRSRLARALAVPIAAVVLTACSHSAKAPGSPDAAPPAPKHDVLVAIGSNATFGDGLAQSLRDAWPQQLYHDAFARSTVFFNAADRFVTVSDALKEQVPLAIQVHATVAAVWLGDADHQDNISAAAFEASIGDLVGRLRAAGVRVAIGNLPTGGVAGFAAYDDAIARVARAWGAVLVDLATELRNIPEIGPSSRIDSATSRTIARAFAAALAPS